MQLSSHLVLTIKMMTMTTVMMVTTVKMIIPRIWDIWAKACTVFLPSPDLTRFVFYKCYKSCLSCFVHNWVAYLMHTFLLGFYVKINLSDKFYLLRNALSTVVSGCCEAISLLWVNLFKSYFFHTFFVVFCT